MPTDTFASRGAVSRRGALGLAAGAALAPLAWGSRSAHATAPMLGAAPPDHYRFKLGEFEVTTISDGAVQVDGPHPLFGENVSAAEVQALAAQNFLPPDRMVIGFAPVVVNTGKELVLFDTGNGVARRPDAGRLASLLATAGFQPEQIDVVVLSHFHPDHVGGLIENGQPLLPNARYVTAAARQDALDFHFTLLSSAGYEVDRAARKDTDLLTARKSGATARVWVASNAEGMTEVVLATGV